MIVFATVEVNIIKLEQSKTTGLKNLTKLISRNSM